MKLRSLLCIALLLVVLAAPLFAQEEPQNETVEQEEEPPEPDISFVDFFPKKFNAGDTQFNLLVKNTGNVVLNNIGGIIAGEGIATYDIVPIERLNPGEKSYILLFISARKAGEIPVEIKILDKVYRTRLLVKNPSEQQDLENKRQAEELLRNRTLTLGQRLSNLTQELDALEEQYYLKKSQNYVLEFETHDAKTYLRNAQASFAKKDLDTTEANLVLLESELSDIQQGLSQAVPRKKPINEQLRDNVPWITALLTGIIAVITITERFRKKSDALKEKLHKAEAELRKRKKNKSR